MAVSRQKTDSKCGKTETIFPFSLTLHTHAHTHTTGGDREWEHTHTHTRTHTAHGADVHGRTTMDKLKLAFYGLVYNKRTLIKHHRHTCTFVFTGARTTAAKSRASL